MSKDKRRAKYARESFTMMTELVLPNDTNMLDTLFGGKMLHWMDIAAGVAGQKHCGSIAVTASVDNVSFKKSIPIGSVVELKANVTRAFNTSMEVFIEASAQNLLSGLDSITHSAFFTMVALDTDGNKIKVPELIPETTKEKELYEGALPRRQFRLMQAGRLSPDEATELKSLFNFKI